MRVDVEIPSAHSCLRGLLPAKILLVVIILLPGCQPSAPRPTKTSAQRGAAKPVPEVVKTPSSRLAASVSGKQLYTRHCSACHGEQGDGKGIAAPFLFPKPRDLRAGRFRLVSTDNNVPTAKDLDAVLLRGMPGSSMPPWGHLTEQERGALVEEVMRFRREGARQQYIALLKRDEQLTDEEIAAEDVQVEIRDFVVRVTTPGESLTVPEFGSPTDEAIAHGKEIYIKQSCHSCHGREGKGDGVQQQFDDEGYPTQPRDYTIGIFKGGHDPASLYRRIAYGMPGTPMPASSKLSPTEVVDLVHYLRSLSTEAQRQRAILKREKVLVKSVTAIPESADSNEWATVPEVSLTMMPLWWRNDADPDLRVQAVHDRKTIALRISWRDAVDDRHAAKSESFEDAVAMQLFDGKQEPFIGMGDANSPTDVWYWDADRQGQPLAVEKLYPRSVVDVFPFSESAVASAELNRPGARTDDQPEISLPARASGNPIVPAGASALAASGASTLTAKGPGSIRFRIPKSQSVTAHGQWKSRRWTALMKRALAVPSPHDGISLQPGGQYSAAFAVWDGSHQDRDGKKLVTIWQDLVLEK